jgi:uncharacterized protein YbgA (DUF1722 family)/uncharacterized protein YbbK (DUF523 family)
MQRERPAPARTADAADAPPRAGAGERRPDPRPPWRDEQPIRIGISSCLLGNAVRWNGGHKRDPFLVDQLARFVEWVPVCPEVEAGMGVPRETVQLVVREGAVHLVASRSGEDWTARMRAFAARRIRILEGLDLCGFVLKKASPSCGLERVPVRNERGMPRKNGRGLFAEALVGAQELLPVEEEGRLHDPRLRENWLERVFAYRRLRSLFTGRWSRRGLVAFHTAHKLQLMAHAPGRHAELGRVVAEAKALGRTVTRERYERGFMEVLGRIATPRRHVNVLHHVLGILRDGLDPADRHELLGLIEDYGRGLVPLVVPITLIRHHVARLGVSYLAGQVYLEPHPRELMLRNHV